MRSLGDAHSWVFSRRQWLQAIGLQALSLGLIDLQQEAAAGAESAPPASLPPLNRFPRMVQEHFVERVRTAERAGLKAQAALKTRADAEAYVQDVRKKIQHCFGPFPAKTPLNPASPAKVERDAYKIEKVIFESRPQFLVTANLYVPKGKKFPLPGVVGSCGHSPTARRPRRTSRSPRGWPGMGYVVLIFDPIGQGERLAVRTSERQEAGRGPASASTCTPATSSS